MRIRTGRQDLVAFDSDADGTWNPMTAALNTVQFANVRFRVWVAALDGIQIAPGIQFSKDSADWDGAERLETLTTLTNDVWNFPEWGDTDVFNCGATAKLYARFGLFAKPTTATQLRFFQGELEIEADPVQSRTVTTPWALVYGKSTQDPRVFPLSAAMPVSEDTNNVRVSVEIESAEGESSDSLNVQPITLEANKPLDPTDWTIGDYIPDSGTWYTASTFGQAFTAVTADKRFIRFGVRVKSGSGNLVAGRVRLRIDYRD